MTVTTPQHLGVNRSKITGLTKTKDAALLNTEDKKVSGSFACKSPVKFWAGLAALCAGIAIGIILTAAVISTGGLAAVVIVAVAATALTTSVVSVGVGMYKQAHDCDCTLQSKWIAPHDTVEIDGAKALLQRSYLQCTKGGKVQPFISGVIAAQAATIFSNNNKAEINYQIGSQFAIGIMSMVSTLGDPVGAVLSSGLTVYSYADGYDLKEKRDYETEKDMAVQDALRDNIKIGLTPSMVVAAKEAAKKVTEMNMVIVPELMEQGVSYGVANQLKDAFGFGMREFAKKAGWNISKSLGAGFIGALINFGIAKWAKKHKKEHIENVKKELENARTEDSKNSIDIMSKE